MNTENMVSDFFLEILYQKLFLKHIFQSILYFHALMKTGSVNKQKCCMTGRNVLVKIRLTLCYLKKS